MSFVLVLCAGVATRKKEMVISLNSISTLCDLCRRRSSSNLSGSRRQQKQQRWHQRNNAHSWQQYKNRIHITRFVWTLKTWQIFLPLKGCQKFACEPITFYHKHTLLGLKNHLLFWCWNIFRLWLDTVSKDMFLHVPSYCLLWSILRLCRNPKDKWRQRNFPPAQLDSSQPTRVYCYLSVCSSQQISKGIVKWV